MAAHSWTRRVSLCAGFIAVLLLGSSCQQSERIDDPVAALATPVQSPRIYRAIIAQMRERPGELTAEELQALRGMMHRPGYIVETREDALNLLAEREHAALLETIDFRLARLDALEWRRRLSQIIGERGWVELTPALVRALAYPMPGWVREVSERPEYLALAQLHGRDGVVDAVFELFRTSRSVAQQGLRRSCWTLLIEFGELERLAELIRSARFPADDHMLLDLKAGAEDLGVIPFNHEEIIWIRRLREPNREAFWNDARSVLAELSLERRAEFELRDLAILIAASRHEPSLIERSKNDLYAEVESRLRGGRFHAPGADRGRSSTRPERLRDHREVVTWGDLAAILMALRAFDVPQVVEHLFDFADRDLLDPSTEYGGVIRLDDLNRFEVIEFPPRVRYGDHRFEASQDMLDEAYTSIFHFHLHAQRHNNATYAGPGHGDLAYAATMRANCLVFTFIDQNTLNVDYYRHGGVIVDLGVIRR